VSSGCICVLLERGAGGPCGVMSIQWVAAGCESSI
jgi:hypothetical protein